MLKKAVSVGYTQDRSTMALWRLGASLDKQLLTHSALVSEAHTHLLTTGKVMLPCAVKVGQEM